jgi:hypothetical protein
MPERERFLAASSRLTDLEGLDGRLMKFTA